MLSTRNLTALADPARLRSLFQSLAILDAVLEPRLSRRSFFFLDQWSISDAVATVRMGEDHLFAAFGEPGAFVKGYVKQCPMGIDGINWPGLDVGLPRVLLEWKLNPYFEFDQTTFCIWRLAEDSAWRRSEAQPPLGEDPDGSALLLGFLDGEPETYARWASARRGEQVDIDAVGYFYDRRVITESILRVLNPKVDLKALAHDLRTTGYPLKSPL